ncbi:MAG: pantoate--beta-alanine ligase [Novosphingobium lindaniclasticum]|jgi:pantoate--beta-alanine ligase|uniref:Pantothenate synthetase n=1 Tax=Novosphingobium lindaniclasticum LE124 TaxID=1096930 RepID=T0I288_9SPHN|nr:pantoate--beta-alanine ligase [Novosphingobium lindaniclasticum]EQB18488.1 pantoate--beta-alanine ligase [Novosphingobium lindaniclasticum LE124]MDF2637606.1 pantoate--beta-alanine ligase [Novosphingobium lindaniclasticum]
MQTLHSLDPLRRAVAELRETGKIALVPTMGALHEGHLTLVREARKRADHVIVSIFVNPLQFGANEDLDKYPRQLERDSALLQGEGVALLWAPTVEAMYPQGFASNISVQGVSEGLCGASRPGHFDGVATVVCKLFHQVLPDVALFGEKDWQQLAVIRRMARDLDLTQPHVDAVLGVPTVREDDGLAMSSRNAYLTPEQRVQAVALPNAMKVAIAEIERGEPVTASIARLGKVLLDGGFSSIDYAELRDADSLALRDERSTAPMRLLVAARIGTTRLIDNMAVTGQ